MSGACNAAIKKRYLGKYGNSVCLIVGNVVKVYTERALVGRRILLGRERAHENMEQVVSGVNIQRHLSIYHLQLANGWSISDKRVMSTHVVATAWIQCCIDKRDMICKAFRYVGSTLPIGGSQESKLAIKGIDSADSSIGMV